MSILGIAGVTASGEPDQKLQKTARQEMGKNRETAGIPGALKKTLRSQDQRGKGPGERD